MKFDEMKFGDIMSVSIRLQIPEAYHDDHYRITQLMIHGIFFSVLDTCHLQDFFVRLKFVSSV